MSDTAGSTPISKTPAERLEQARAVFNSVPADKVVAGVTNLFTLEKVAEDRFIYFGNGKASRDRLFGGQVIAQAMLAAALTVDEGRPVHSLHAYFLRAGDEAQPMHFEVWRDFDGGSFSNRRVVVRQGDGVIFNLTASFQKPREGLSHSITLPADVVPPEDCPEFLDYIAAIPDLDDKHFEIMSRPRPFELRTMKPRTTESGSHQYQCFKLRAPIGDDPMLHRAALAFASDMGLLSTSMLPHGLTWASKGVISTSLDHAMWFHGDMRVDEWFVYVMDCDWTGGERGLNRGTVFTRDGRLVASTVQEGLLRYRL